MKLLIGPSLLLLLSGAAAENCKTYYTAPGWSDEGNVICENKAKKVFDRCVWADDILYTDKKLKKKAGIVESGHQVVIQEGDDLTYFNHHEWYWVDSDTSLRAGGVRPVPKSNFAIVGGTGKWDGVTGYVIMDTSEEKYRKVKMCFA